MKRWRRVAPIVVIAIAGAYFLNPFKTATWDPRARLLGAIPYRVTSMAMAPTLVAGDLIVARTSVYSSQPPQRGDIVVFRSPKERSHSYIFRVAAVPGDRFSIQNGVLHINDQPVAEPFLLTSEPQQLQSLTVNEMTIPEGHIYVLGDNRDNANDSRYWGTVPIEDVIGKVTYIYSSGNSERIGAVH